MQVKDVGSWIPGSSDRARRNQDRGGEDERSTGLANHTRS